MKGLEGPWHRQAGAGELADYRSSLGKLAAWYPEKL